MFAHDNASASTKKIKLHNLGYLREVAQLITALPPTEAQKHLGHRFFRWPMKNDVQTTT